MPDWIADQMIREVEPLRGDEPIGEATQKVIEAGLPALPVVDDEGRFVGIFGEREFLEAFFPGYVDTLASAKMVRRTMEDSIERRISCLLEPVSDHLTTDHVLVEDDYSDTQLAELFLHHRVLVIPIATKGRVHAVVARSDFFRGLFERARKAG